MTETDLNQAKIRILLLCGCVLLLLGVPVISHAQILKDRGKLKTVKSEGRSFLLFARKIKTESPRKKTVKKRGGRSSASAPLFGSRIKAVSPRYSKRRFIAGRPSAGPRTTPGKKPVKKGATNNSKPPSKKKNEGDMQQKLSQLKGLFNG